MNTSFSYQVPTDLGARRMPDPRFAPPVDRLIALTPTLRDYQQTPSGERSARALRAGDAEGASGMTIRRKRPLVDPLGERWEAEANIMPVRSGPSNALPTRCPNRCDLPKLEPTRPHENCGKRAGVCASPRNVGVD
jgi:hypothetical protein